MSFPSKKRQRADEADLHASKRPRASQANQHPSQEPRTDCKPPHTPSPSAGTKRSSPHEHASNTPPPQPIDTKALYEAHKAEIETWYDRDFSLKQGIPAGGRVLKSNHRWYQKVHAWMKAQGLAQSPRKKRRLNDGSSVSGMQEQRERKPHHVRYPGDLVGVPEYPLDRLEDYTVAPDGRYACSHVHLEPPRDCCRFGLTRSGKKAAIKKDVLRWKGRVEKLVDRKQLDRRHVTWPGWTVQELRRKYQPEVWERQQLKKQADREKKRMEDKRQSRRREMGSGNAGEAAGQRTVQQSVSQRPAQITDAQQRNSARSTSTRATTAAIPALHPSAPSPIQRPIVPMRRRGDPNIITSAQATFLVEQARTNPRLLRSHEALYHDAQYREDRKEHPDFALLRKWYLAYFLKQQRQPLTSEQQAMLENGDPSREGRKRNKGVPTLGKVDKLFGEYLQIARAEETQRSQKGMQQPAPSAGQVSKQAPSNSATSPVVQESSLAQAETYDFDELFGDTGKTPPVTPVEQFASQTPFKVSSPEELESELDNILGRAPSQTAQPAVSTVEAIARDTMTLRTKNSYLTTLPQAFATGNRSVDDKTQKLLEYAYQTATSQQHISEDERLLRRTVEDCKPDWQRYCDFFDDEQSSPCGTASIGEAEIDEFEISEQLSKG
jgi:hypothetical protein